MVEPKKMRFNEHDVFKYTNNEIQELLKDHGISDKTCVVLSDITTETWEKYKEIKDKESLKKNLENDFQSLKELSDDDWQHLLAVLNKYQRNNKRLNYKLIGDNIHGQIKVHPLLVRIIDTPQFQRLRHLKQLGAVTFVYPTANHTRFEHCIGTSYICDVFMNHLKENQPSLNINLQDELCVRIAGLCHDLGHGPFSHMFEEVLNHVCPDKKWKHEEASLKLFDKMLKDTEHLREDFESYGLFENDIQFIKDLIHCDKFKSDSNESYEKKLKKIESLKKKGFDKSYLFEIVSNNRSGIDVDKFDYFERDSKNLGYSNNFNYKRYIVSSRVIKSADGFTQICCRDKNFQDLYEMFHVRERLTRKAYKHETGSSINLMIVEALKLATKHYKFDDITDDMDKYLKLNDSIYLEILHSEHEDLKKASELLKLVEKRKFYKYVGSCVIPSDEQTDLKDLKNQLLKFMESESKKEITETNICFELVKFNWGSKNLNPLENVHCYNKYQPDRLFKIGKDQISIMLQDKFEERVIRVFSKQIDDYDFFKKVSEHFELWCDKKEKERNISKKWKMIYGMNSI